MSIERADRIFDARRKIPDLFRKALSEKQQTLERNIFAERHKVHLIVPRDDITLRVEQGCAVGWILAKHIDVADQKVSAELPRDRLHASAEVCVVAQIEWSR